MGKASGIKYPRYKPGPNTKRALGNRQGWECCYCQIDMSQWVIGDLTVEHLIAGSAFNSGDRKLDASQRNHPTNIMLACGPCNSRKGNAHYVPFCLKQYGKRKGYRLIAKIDTLRAMPIR